jgi:chemotaxis protein MotB
MTIAFLSTSKSVQKLKERIQKAIKEQKDLEKLAKQIEITITPEGLRIELIEDKSGTFFQSGSAKLSQSGQELLGMLAGQLKPLPNQLLLEGHTDAQPYSADNAYTNWELSADRANAARRLLQQDGVGKIADFAGARIRRPTAASEERSLDPSNRRISLIVQWVEGPNCQRLPERTVKSRNLERRPRRRPGLRPNRMQNRRLDSLKGMLLESKSAKG